jgi:hypothetical protein
MYHTGLDPRTMEPVYVAKSLKEKQYQRALIHYNKPENHRLVKEALAAAGREDLIPVLCGGRTGEHRDRRRHGKHSGNRKESAQKRRRSKA